MKSFSEFKIGMKLRSTKTTSIYSVEGFGPDWCMLRWGKHGDLVEILDEDDLQKYYELPPTHKIFVSLIRNDTTKQIHSVGVRFNNYDLGRGYTIIARKEIEIEEGEGL